jgi:hypothetical protein
MVHEYEAGHRDHELAVAHVLVILVLQQAGDRFKVYVADYLRVTATAVAGKRLDSGGLHLGGCPLRSRLQLSCLLDGGVLCSGLLRPGQQVRLDPHEVGDPRRA